jgi:ATP-binding cassette subfamily B protein
MDAAERSGLPLRRLGNSLVTWDEFSRWLDRTGEALGFEVQATQACLGELDGLLATGTPVLLSLSVHPSEFCLLLRSNSTHAYVIGADGEQRRMRLVELREWLCKESECPRRKQVEVCLVGIDLPAKQKRRAQSALLEEWIAPLPLPPAWMLKKKNQSVFERLRGERTAGAGLALIGLALSTYALTIAIWYWIGSVSLSGNLDWGSLGGWGLALFTLALLQSAASWLQGKISIKCAIVFREKFLTSIFAFDVDAMRRSGIGEVVGRVFETEALETLALSGGFASAFAFLELLIAAIILALAAGGPGHALLLLLWTAGTSAFAWRFFGARSRWTLDRLAITRTTIENMVGYRTRVVQQSPGGLHSQEDAALESYISSSLLMDRASVWLTAISSRGWLVVGLLGLVAAIGFGNHPIGAVAASLGGIIYAYRALQKFTSGAVSVASAAVAGRSVFPLLSALPKPQPARVSDSVSPAAQIPVCDVRSVSYRYAGRNESSLEHCDIAIASGEKVLLMGPSGGGKSTLCALMAGLRQPQGGLVLASALDLNSRGIDDWRRHISAAPQFHENYVFTESLAFNLLMGRRWPASAQDLDEAQDLCRSLGLGPLLDRMPSGLMQMVGESGWQLSHGECSRLFMARALLQKPRLLILDESLAPLDADMFLECLRFLAQKTDALLVVIHP